MAAHEGQDSWNKKQQTKRERISRRPIQSVFQYGLHDKIGLTGYQAAILSEIIVSVYTIEIKTKLADQAARRLKKLGYSNVQAKSGDGYFGWPEAAPFDAIIITCAVNHVPPRLLEQLKIGGRMILPLGSTFYYQTLIQVTKQKDDIKVDYLGMVAFVPMTGQGEKN